MHSPESLSHTPGHGDRVARTLSGLLPTAAVAALVVVGLSVLSNTSAEETQSTGRPAGQASGQAVRQQVRATGRVEATDATPVPCLVEGGARVISVVSHGTPVLKGEILARLDTAGIEQSIHETGIKLAAARAAQEVARQDGIIQENTLARETEAAELAVTLARLDRKRYLDGELVHDTARLNRDVDLAARRLELANQRLVRARGLADRGLLAPGQVQGDQASVDRARARSDAATRELKRLRTSRQTRRLLELDAALAEAAERLEQASVDAIAARRTHTQALEASRLAVEAAKGSLAQLEHRRRQSVLTAPHDGVVLHPVATARTEQTPAMRGPSRRSGDRVKKWEPVVMLARRLRSRVRARLPVADSSRIQVGQPVEVRLGDPESGSVEFQGTVSHVATASPTSPRERRVDVMIPVLSSTAHFVGHPVSLRIQVAEEVPARAVQTQPVTTGRVEGHLFETGQVERADGIPLTSPAEGPVVISRIAAPGTTVKAGDTLVEFDTEALTADIASQAVAVAQATAALSAQQRRLADVRSKCRRSMASAKLGVETATLDLEEYQAMTFVQSRGVLDREIGALIEDQRRARARLVWAERVLKKGYITRASLEADRLVVTEVENKLKEARGRLGLLIDHTRVRELKRREAQLASVKRELERTRQETAALVAREMAIEGSLAFARQVESRRMAAWKTQLAAARLTAIRDGVVVSCAPSPSAAAAKSDSVVAGSVVHPGQPLLVLAPSPGGPATVRLNPSRTDLVQAGQAAKIQVSGDARRELPGRVAEVASDAQVARGDKRGPGAKPLGGVVVSIDKSNGQNAPMPGETALVKVRVKRDDVLRVPSQAVLEDGQGTFCYVRTKQGIRRRDIVSGLRTSRHVEVKSGVRRGDLVVTNPMSVDRGQLR